MVEEVVHAFVAVNALDRLADQRRDAEHRQLERQLRGIKALAERNGVRADELPPRVRDLRFCSLSKCA